ncbi:MAG: NAD(P)/FAD-dependent oxidoreductase [Clostridia bacterium]|nr:NAD(P)/FAD-dependent oxidoreductase [Clostridia bacterium]
MADYIIVGNGAAALACIDGIRHVDREAPITVISAEKHPAYCRPLISYALEGRAKPENMGARADDYYEKNGCTVLYGEKAVKLDPAAHTVTLDSGRVLPYGKLCAATGSSPFVPPIEGLDTVEEKFTFMTMDDMLALDAAVKPDSTVMIVGAGLIGLKCAEGLAGRVKSMTVCDLAPRVLSSVLDEEGAALMQAKLEERGITFLLGDTAAKFEGCRAVMKSGKTVDFDVLVLAVGVRANTALIREAGGAVNRGILTDTRMRTSLPDVYAAGDCAEGYDASIGANRVLAILPNARLQGECAGENMAGGDRVFDNAVPMNAIGFFGLHALTAGRSLAPDEGGEIYEERTNGGLKKLYVKDGLLIGFELVGVMERAGICTSLIREKIPLSTLDFDLMRRGATTAAFSPEVRRQKFGGAV